MLTNFRYHQIAQSYASLKVALVGDFCLDRYLEIDPDRSETSIETGLPVHNVVRVRAQPGGAGTILNNLAALGVGEIYPIGFCGDDGEGFELRRAIAALAPSADACFLTTPLRRTFTYCKPLVIRSDQPPEELNRLDSKNWSPTPPEVSRELAQRLSTIAERVDAVILLDQVDVPETGVLTSALFETVADVAGKHPDVFIIADSRRGLAGFPPLAFKMNRSELEALAPDQPVSSIDAAGKLAGELAAGNQRHVFVTLAEGGIIGADPGGQSDHARSLPTRGAIDIVGAGDCVTANLTAALAAGASLSEALEIAMAAASIVVHKLGTTGTASVAEISDLIVDCDSLPRISRSPIRGVIRIAESDGRERSTGGRSSAICSGPSAPCSTRPTPVGRRSSAGRTDPQGWARTRGFGSCPTAGAASARSTTSGSSSGF